MRLESIDQVILCVKKMRNHGHCLLCTLNSCEVSWLRTPTGLPSTNFSCKHHLPEGTSQEYKSLSVRRLALNPLSHTRQGKKNDRVGHLRNGILLSHKKEENVDICNSINGPGKLC